ncbi:hypothetical protein GCM10023085_76970 [Actinomadura viridis]
MPAHSTQKVRGKPPSRGRTKAATRPAGGSEGPEGPGGTGGTGGTGEADGPASGSIELTAGSWERAGPRDNDLVSAK